MVKNDTLFTGLHQLSCASCLRDEPKEPMPGWPLQGRFLVIGHAKLCFSCAREVLKKISAISEHQRFTSGNL